MLWRKVSRELRAIIAFAVASLIFVPVFLLAPADDFRVAAIAFLTGAITATVCWKHFPGWDIFTAGCAFALAGNLHAMSSDQWLYQALLLLPALICWYWGARVAEEMLILPFGYHESSMALNWERLCQDKRKGIATTLSSLLWGLIVMIPLAEALPIIAFPLSFLATFLVNSRWHISRPLWPTVGWLLALPLSGIACRYIYARMQAPPPYLADPWLSGGLICLGTICGVWMARWQVQRQIENATCQSC